MSNQIPATIIKTLKRDFPNILFKKGAQFKWSPDEQTIFYTKDLNDYYSLFHELGHAVLNHEEFTSDLNLVHLEIEAWEEGKKIAKNYGVQIDEDYIHECLESYRNWLGRRCICPECDFANPQDTNFSFTCFNCSHRWRVEAAQH